MIQNVERSWRWPRSRWPYGAAALFVVVALAYAAGLEFAFLLIDLSDLDGAFFIPSGITIAFLLRVERRLWWVVLAAVATSEVTLDLLSGLSLQQSLGFALANVSEPLLGATIIISQVGWIDLARRRDVTWFVLGGVLAGPALGATIGATVDALFGGDAFWQTLGQWWLGDALGVILVGGAILVWNSSPDRRSVISWLGSVLLVGSSALTVIVFLLTDQPLLVPVVVAVVLAGIFFGIRAVAITALAVALTLVATVAIAQPAMVLGASGEASTLALQLQIGVFALAGMLVAAEANERELAVQEATEASSRAKSLELERQREHDLAVRVQKGFLRDRPLRKDNVRIAARYEAASELLEVGGDWYDTIQLHDGRIGIVIGDIVGHGVDAMISMGRLRTAFVALSRNQPGPAELLEAIDQFVAGPDGTDPATAFYGVLDPVTKSFVYSSAGHPPPLLISPNGESRWLDEGSSQPLFGQSGYRRRQASVQIEDGSVLVAYSDGLIERRKETLSTGMERLEEEARRLVGLSPDEMCNALVAALGVDRERRDDVVVLALSMLADLIASYSKSFVAAPSELSSIRASVAEWLAGQALPATTVNDLMLVIGEASANAARHAYIGREPGPVDVVIDRFGERLDVSIRDYGQWREGTDQSLSFGTEILNVIGDRVRVNRSKSGTAVMMEVPIEV